MRKIYRKLTVDQRARGVVFSSSLSETRQEGRVVHEVRADDPDKDRLIKNLLEDSFFDDPMCQYKFNIVRR